MLNFYSQTKYICTVYLSLNSTNYQKFFDHLLWEVEIILSFFSYSDISILRDCNLNQCLWLFSNFTDSPGEQDFNFAILNDLDQIVQHSTRILYHPENHPNILNVCLISHFSGYSIENFSSLGSSDPNLLSVFTFVDLLIPLNPPKKWHLWHCNAPNQRDLRWNDYCFRGRDAIECGDCIAEVIFSCMKANIHISFP